MQFHLLLVTHTHATNAVMPFFDRVSVHSALQVLLNVVLQLFALLLALSDLLRAVYCLRHFCEYGCLSACNKSRTAERVFIKFDIANCNKNLLVRSNLDYIWQQ